MNLRELTADQEAILSKVDEFKRINSRPRSYFVKS